MSMSFVEVCGSSVRDMLDVRCLEAAGIDAAHVVTTSMDSYPVHEVLALHRVKSFALLHEVLTRRTPSSAIDKRHFIACIRVERAHEHKVSTLVIADLAGTVEVDASETRDSFKAGVASNSNLVCAFMYLFHRCWGVSAARLLCFEMPHLAVHAGKLTLYRKSRFSLASDVFTCACVSAVPLRTNDSKSSCQCWRVCTHHELCADPLVARCLRRLLSDCCCGDLVSAAS